MKTPRFRDPNNRLPIGTLDGVENFGKGLGCDLGIRHYVDILRSQGIETCQSCQGGPGHSYLEPTVDFRGEQGDGPRAIGAALIYGLPVSELQRVWHVRDGELDGPIWRMTFRIGADVHQKRIAERSAAWFRTKKTGRVQR